MSEENYNENGCFTHEYPYTSHRELNLDWLIKLVQSKKVKDIEVTTNADHTYTVVITYADSTTATLNLASDVNLQEIYAIIEQQAILRRLFIVNYGSTNFTELNDAFTEGRVMACKKGTDLFFYDSKKAVYHDGAYYTRYTFKGLSDEKKTMYITVEQHTQTLAVTWAYTETALQEELVSGTNIKTVNGESILGSGNLAVTSVYMAEYNVATYAQVKAAWDAGKTIIMYRIAGGNIDYAMLTDYTSAVSEDMFVFTKLQNLSSDRYVAHIYTMTYNKLTFVTSWVNDADYLAMQDNIAPEYDETATYLYLYTCFHDGKFYTCIDAEGTSGPWDPEKWEETSVGDILAALQDSKKDRPYINTSIHTPMNVNTQYYLGTQTTVNLQTPTGATEGDEILVVFYSGGTAATLNISGSYIGNVPTPIAYGRVELSFLYDGTNWSLLSNITQVSP